MVDYIKHVLTAQFEASLCMLHRGIMNCPTEHWEGKITRDSIRQVAYHTLFFTDLYLAPTEEAFSLNDFNQRGGDERLDVTSPGLIKEDTLAYLAFCRQKMIQTLAAETEVSLKGASGFSYRRFSRGELHVYSMRHVQHHAGQISAYLRRVADTSAAWVGSGWKE